MHQTDLLTGGKPSINEWSHRSSKRPPWYLVVHDGKVSCQNAEGWVTSLTRLAFLFVLACSSHHNMSDAFVCPQILQMILHGTGRWTIVESRTKSTAYYQTIFGEKGKWISSISVQLRHLVLFSPAQFLCQKERFFWSRTGFPRIIPFIQRIFWWFQSTDR